MKKIIYIILFTISILSFAQKVPNRFEEEGATPVPQQEMVSERNILEDPVDPIYGGNPADTVPIDDYIPLLIITAVGLIVYIKYRKNSIL